jgi:hypothetical protein
MIFVLAACGRLSGWKVDAAELARRLNHGFLRSGSVPLTSPRHSHANAALPVEAAQSRREFPSVTGYDPVGRYSANPRCRCDDESDGCSRTAAALSGWAAQAWPHEETERGHARESQPASASIKARSFISGLVRKRTPIQRPDSSTITAGLCQDPTGAGAAKMLPRRHPNLLNDLVGGKQELRRDRQAERLGGP